MDRGFRTIGRTLFSRILHNYFLLSRSLTIGVRAIIQSSDGRFLLVRHTYTSGWHFPGGGVERNETVLGALNKELLQETGLRLVAEPRLHGVFHNNNVSKRDHVLTYICKVDAQLAPKPCSFEIAEVKYFDISNLPAETDAGTVRRMKEVVDGKVVCETW